MINLKYFSVSQEDIRESWNMFSVALVGDEAAVEKTYAESKDRPQTYWLFTYLSDKELFRDAFVNHLEIKVYWKLYVTEASRHCWKYILIGDALFKFEGYTRHKDACTYRFSEEPTEPPLPKKKSAYYHNLTIHQKINLRYNHGFAMNFYRDARYKGRAATHILNNDERKQCNGVGGIIRSNIVREAKSWPTLWWLEDGFIQPGSSLRPQYYKPPEDNVPVKKKSKS
jgi:hypothetical protein